MADALVACPDKHLSRLNMSTKSRTIPLVMKMFTIEEILHPHSRIIPEKNLNMSINLKELKYNSIQQHLQQKDHHKIGKSTIDHHHQHQTLTRDSHTKRKSSPLHKEHSQHRLHTTEGNKSNRHFKKSTTRHSSPDDQLSDYSISSLSDDSNRENRQKSRARSKSVHKKKLQDQAKPLKKSPTKAKITKPIKPTKTTSDQAQLVQRLLLDITEKYKNLNNAQNTCYINKLEKKTMVHEINVLAKALIKNEKKFIKMQDKYRKQLKEVRKHVKSQDTSLSKLDQENFALGEHMKSLKANEEHLLHDLVKQQKIAKESLRALENLSDKYDKEKRELICRLEREREDALKREEQKYDIKINSIKALNDQMNQKIVTLNETEEDFQALQKNYNEAIQIIEDQKRELHQAMREIDDLRTRNGQLEEEIKDVQAMLQEQQKIYSSHINELRVQLNELEDATRNKYEEQIVALQLDLKMKAEQLNRAVQEKELIERKLKQKLEEAGFNTQQVQREVFEKEEQRDEMIRVMKNQEFEIEKLKRIIANKEEEAESEKRRFSSKWERKCKEQEKERQEWSEMYQVLQREVQQLRTQVQDRDTQLQLTMRRSSEGMSFKSSLQQSPTSSKHIYVEGVGNSNQVSELQEQLKTKEEEIKILWNVIKEINKSKGSEKVSMEQLKQVISSKIQTNYNE